MWSPSDQPDDDGFLEDEIRTLVDIAAGHRGKKAAAHARGAAASSTRSAPGWPAPSGSPGPASRARSNAASRVAMGTDCGIADNGTNLRELGLLVEYGMAPMDALLAGTREAAELLGMSAEIGTLEAGRRADIVIARGNPLADIASLGKSEGVAAVLKDGVAYKDLDGAFEA